MNIEKIIIKTFTNSKDYLPIKGTKDSAGYDLFSFEDLVLQPNNIYKISTDIFLDIPKGYFGKIESRSSCALKGLLVIGGVIDSDYKQEVKVLINYIGKEEYKIIKGMKIAQILFFENLNTQIQHVGREEISISTTRNGGFGSTGV